MNPLRSVIDFFLGAASRVFVKLPFRVRMRIVKSLNNLLLYFNTRP